MLRIILKILTFSLPLTVNPSFAQEIWKENFSIPGKGIWGNEDGTVQCDFSGITTWTLDTAGIMLSGPDDYAKTVTTSGGRFECRDINGEIAWRSEKIDISAFNEINICLTAYETGSGKNPDTKYLKAFYRLDDGNEAAFKTNSENMGNWGSVIADQPGLKGNTLQIICYIANHYASDKVTLDEVTVWAKEEIPPPVDKYDVVISEILFNPFAGGEDFVEIYNLSEKHISTDRLFIANRNRYLQLNQIFRLSHVKNTLSPGCCFTPLKK